MRRALESGWSVVDRALGGLLIACILASSSHADEVLGGVVRFMTTPEPQPTLEARSLPSEFGFGGGSPDGPMAGGPFASGPFTSRLATRPFRTSDPDDPFRHMGRGDPLVGTSWLNRPLHAGWFVGALMGDSPIDGRVDQESDLFGGYRVGWDWDHYWGGEARFAFARPNLVDDSSLDDPRIVRDWFGDLHLVHYPWGDSGWRPFVSVGIGFASFRFRDADGIQYAETLTHVPIGVGVKYFVDQWMVLRADATDNLALSGSGLDTMHNVTFTFGLEAHFR